jgi:hypothetical protein
MPLVEPVTSATLPESFMDSPLQHDRSLAALYQSLSRPSVAAVVASLRSAALYLMTIAPPRARTYSGRIDW